jgi:hypothetical protein
MGGFAALLGGMAEPAQSYAHDVRNQHLQIWGTHQKNLMDMLDKSYEVAGTPEARAGILATRGKVAKLKPGDDPSKLLEEANAWLMPHPTVVQALTPGEPQKQPGPAQPGQTPGTPQIAPIAAQPTGSPVQPGSQPQQPQAQGGAMAGMLSSTTGQQALELYNRFIQAGQIPPEHVRVAAQPYLTNDAELSRTRGMLDTQLSYKKAGIEALHKSGTWDKLQPFQQAGYEGEGYGLSPINLPASAMVPRLMGNDVPGDSAPPNQMDAFGNPVVRDSGHLYRLEQDQLTGVPRWYPRAAQTITTQNEGGVQLNNRQTGAKVGDVQGAIPPPMNIPKVGTTSSGAEVLYTPAGVMGGVPPTPIPGVVNASTLPSVHEGFTPVQTIENGVPVTKLVPTTTTTKKGGADAGIPPVAGVSSAAAPKAGAGAGGRTFEKSLTPLQTLTETQKYEQLNTAVERAKRVLENSHLLDSMIESGKLELQLHDGLLANVLSRGFKLTPQEAQLATDFNSLRESVNLVRGALGATGFRGPEAFAALQAQRGKLMGNPQVTRGALSTLIKELQNQSQPIARKLRLGAQAPPPASDPAGLRHLLGK